MYPTIIQPLEHQSHPSYYPSTHFLSCWMLVLNITMRQRLKAALAISVSLLLDIKDVKELWLWFQQIHLRLKPSVYVGQQLGRKLS